MKAFIKKIENEFDIKMIKSDEAIDFENTYTIDKDGNITTLRLQEIPINSLDFLLPISDNLEDLFLQDCEINNIKSISVFKQLKKLDLSKEEISDLLAFIETLSTPTRRRRLKRARSRRSSRSRKSRCAPTSTPMTMR